MDLAQRPARRAVGHAVDPRVPAVLRSVWPPVIAELSSRHPEQGGIYAWARRAFGPAHGFICGWCMWVNNLFYFPALLLFAGANLLVPLGADGAAIADSRWYSVTFVLGLLWSDDVPQHLRLLGRQVDAAHRQRRDVDSRRPADRRRRDCLRDVRQRDVVRALELIPRENSWTR